MESAELIEILREVRDRVRARNPEAVAAPGAPAGSPGVPLPDLMPLVHARDAALGKVAAIGSVNPRRGGVVNGVVQTCKRGIARVLDWHIRDQVEFNRRLVDCVDAAIEAMTDLKGSIARAQSETNRAIDALGARLEVVDELKDIRGHWASWRAEWERKLQVNETQFLRSVADLQGAFQHRVNLLDANYRDTVRGQHAAFTAELDRRANDIQQRLWADMERIRADYDRMIHSELRVIRQRAAVRQSAAAPVEAAPAAPAAEPELQFDYARFAERFRGTEEYVRASQQFYRPYFEGKQSVLDLGCGRGEFLELMREMSVPARGIDSSEESVALCRAKGLDAETADLFERLVQLHEGSLDGIFCSQVVEHIPPARLPELIRLAAAALERGGRIAIETPNPECLAIFATHFYLDPTHQRPVPSALLSFYLEEFGVGKIEVRRLSPAVETMPSLRELPEDFRNAFFGGLDYAITGVKL